MLQYLAITIECLCVAVILIWFSFILAEIVSGKEFFNARSRFLIIAIAVFGMSYFDNYRESFSKVSYPFDKAWTTSMPAKTWKYKIGM